MSPIQQQWTPPRWATDADRFARSLIRWLPVLLFAGLPLLGPGAAWLVAVGAHRWLNVADGRSVTIAGTLLQLGALVVGAVGLAKLQGVLGRDLLDPVREAWAKRPRWRARRAGIMATGLSAQLAKATGAASGVGTHQDPSWQEAVRRLDAKIDQARRELVQRAERIEQNVGKIETTLRKETEALRKDVQAVRATVDTAFSPTGAWFEFTALVWLLVGLVGVAFPALFTGLL